MGRCCPDGCRLRLKCDGTRAETSFRLSAKRTSPFKSARASVQSTAGSRGVRISGNGAGYIMFRGSVKSTDYPLINQFPLHFPSRALPCAITFQLDSTTECRNARLEETSWRYRRMEMPCEGGQGPERAVAPYMDG